MGTTPETHESHDIYFTPEGFWMCRKCALCICHNREAFKNECSGRAHERSSKKEVPTVRVTLELEGLSMSEASLAIDALNAVEISFKRISSIVEVEED